jgi:hypothetical protein
VEDDEALLSVVVDDVVIEASDFNRLDIGCLDNGLSL